MRKISLIIFLIALALVFSWSITVQAANNEFTASGDVTVELTGGNVTILSGSTAEIVDITGGVLTVSNPGSTSTPLFKLQPAGGGTVSIKATLNGADAGCSASTLVLPTTPGPYIVTPQNGQCSGAGGTGQTTGGGGGGTTTTTPTPTPTATSTPTTTTTVPAGVISNIGALGVDSKNVNLSLNSQINFTTSLSTAASASHSAKVTAVDTTNKKVTVVLQSDPVTIDLTLGEVKKVDLDGDGVNDISVKFNNLIGSTVDLVIANIANLEKIGLSAGDLIKTAKNSAVYYINSKGERHLFVNAVTFWTWYSGSWSKITYGTETKTIKIVSQDDFDQVALGANMTVKPTNKLIKFQNSPRVYVVTKGAILRQVVSGAGDNSVAKKLYGADYAQKVITIQDGFENDYTPGEALTDTSVAPTETEEISQLF